MPKSKKPNSFNIGKNFMKDELLKSCKLPINKVNSVSQRAIKKCQNEVPLKEQAQCITGVASVTIDLASSKK